MKLDHGLSRKSVYKVFFWGLRLSSVYPNIFFLSFDTALPPREDDYVQVDCVLKLRYKKYTEKENIKMIVLKRMYKKN